MHKIINIKILDKQIKNNFTLPQYSTQGSAGLDLRASLNTPLKISPNKTYLISTGLAIHIKEKRMAAIILPRSGLSHKHGITLGNSIGLIDSDYQGPLMLSIWNRSQHTTSIKPGERIAQLIFIPIIKVQFNIVTSFKKKTHRNTRGFGSTGKF